MNSDDSRDTSPEEDYIDTEDIEEDEEHEGSEMSFLEHLEEARQTLIICAVALILSCSVVFAFLKDVSQFLQMPLHIASGGTAELDLTTATPMGVFSVILQAGFICGFIVSLPIILYSLSKFIAPGLKEREIKVITPLSISIFFLFLLGATFSFFVLLPAAIKAAMFFNHLLGFETIWRADSYFSLVMWTVLAVGLSFQCPIVIIALVYVGLVSIDQLKAFRPYSIVIFLALAAIITPTTDPFTFLLLAVPMSGLYEAGLRVSARMEKKRVAEEKEDTA